MHSAWNGSEYVGESKDLLPADDPLILTLGEGHQAHAAIENGPHIFSVSEDVPEEFRTVNGYVSNDY